MKHRFMLIILGSLLGLSPLVHAQVPQIINYQGRILVGSVNYTGQGQFKFALVVPGVGIVWTNDGTGLDGKEPGSAVPVNVSNGLYSVLLGDTALPNMTSIPRTVFDHSEVQLRVWFNDGSKGSQLLTPDQRIAAVGYAFMAARVGDSFTGALISTNGSQFNIAAPNGINLTTTGTGSTGVAITTKFDPKGAPALSVPGGILADNVFATKSLIGKNLEVTNTVFADQGQFTGEVRASAFVPSSDRNAKDQFRFVNAREILSRLAAIPIQTWKFKQDSTRTPHIGPMAQDFYAAFQVGSDDKHIATVDADGVAFAAIQGLNEIVQEQNSELAAKTERIDGLEKRLIELEKRLNQNAK